MNIKDLPTGSYTPVQPERLNIKNLPANSYTPVKQSIQITPQEAQAELARRKSLEPEPGYLGRVGNEIAGFPQKIANNIEATKAQLRNGDYARAAGSLPRAMEAVEGVALSPFTQAPIIKDYPKVTGAVLGGIAGLPYGAAGVGAGAAAGAGLVAGQEQLQKHVNSPEYAAFATEHPTISGLAETAGHTVNAVGQAALMKAPFESIAKIGKNPAITAQVAKTAITNKVVANETKEWARPAKLSKPSYSRARDVYENAQSKNNDVAQTLVKNKINLSDNIEEGNYATAASAQKIRDNAARLSREGLRPALQQAAYTAPKVPISEIVQRTINDIKSSKQPTYGDIETQIQRAKDEGKVLAENKDFANGMDLVQMHDEKIRYANNGKYSPVGDTNVNNSAGVNRAFGRTLAGLVEEKAPKEIPVHDFNAELTKLYQASDYLDALDTKKVTRGLPARIARGTARLTGGIIGAKSGGGIFGVAAGYHIGGMLESMVENMPLSAQRVILKNLKTENPAAFQAVAKYLGDEKMRQLNTLQLPAPKGMPMPSYKGSNIPISQQAKDAFSAQQSSIRSQNERDVFNFQREKDVKALEALRAKGARYGSMGEIQSNNPSKKLPQRSSVNQPKSKPSNKSIPVKVPQTKKPANIPKGKK